MKFLLDESADARLADYLSHVGHDVTTIARDHTPSIQDTEVLAIAHRTSRILITNDKDFGDLVFARRQPHAGVVLFRLITTDLSVKIARLDHVLAHYADQLDQFLVVSLRNVRVRPTVGTK